VHALRQACEAKPDGVALTKAKLWGGRSPDQLQPKLDLARGGRGCRDDASRGTRYDRCGGKDNRIRCSEIRAVQQIEKLRSKLKSYAFRNGRVFQQGRVQFRESGSDQNVPAGISIRAVRRNEKGIRIVVLIRAAEHQLSLESRIPRGPNRVAAIAIVRRIKSQLRGEWEPRL
jgi:hypothetical protein